MCACLLVSKKGGSMGARIGPFRAGLLMVAVGARIALGVAWIALAATQAGAALINPGFETGDATGWQSYIDDFAVVSDGASEGSHYLTALVDWQFFPGVPGLGGSAGWQWHAGADQTFNVPAWATWMSVDIRAAGVDPGCGGVHLMHSTSDGLSIDFFAIVKCDGTPSLPAPNGFRRYMIDISGAAGLENVEISVSAKGSAAPTPEPPEGFIEFSVDNFQIVPEPAMLALVALGGAGMLLQRWRK